MFQLKSRKSTLTPLAPPPSTARFSATVAEQQLRILSPSQRADLIDNCRGDLNRELTCFPHRLSRLKFRQDSMLEAAEQVDITFGTERAVVSVGAIPGHALRDAYYHRIADIAPLLDYASSKIESGRVAFDLSDAGSVDRISFSGPAGAALIPDCSFLSTTSYEVERAAYKAAPAWRDRRSTVLWRGATTGLYADWRDLPRTRLCQLALKSAQSLQLDCGFTGVSQIFDEKVVESIINSGLMRTWIPAGRFGEYRHHIDIDGNTNSWPGLFTKLLSGGTVFKVASAGFHTQWYYPRLVAWRHYIPVEPDLSDLEDRVAWAHEHPQRAEEIAVEGQALARSMTIETEADFAVAVIRSTLGNTGANS